MKHRIPICLLVRVSSTAQDVQRQIAELYEYAEKNSYEVVEICREVVSGSAEQSDRSGLARVEELARQGVIKKVAVSEISRIARKNSVAHKFVETMTELGVSVFWLAQNIETLMTDGRRNPAAGVMLALMAELARNEVEILRERILSGLSNARSRGVRLGRPSGSALPRAKFLQVHRVVVRLLQDGHSIRNAAKIANRAPSTVQLVRRALRS